LVCAGIYLTFFTSWRRAHLQVFLGGLTLTYSLWLAQFTGSVINGQTMSSVPRPPAPPLADDELRSRCSQSALGADDELRSRCSQSALGADDELRSRPSQSALGADDELRSRCSQSALGADDELRSRCSQSALGADDELRSRPSQSALERMMSCVPAAPTRTRSARNAALGDVLAYAVPSGSRRCSGNCEASADFAPGDCARRCCRRGFDISAYLSCGTSARYFPAGVSPLRSQGSSMKIWTAANLVIHSRRKRGLFAVQPSQRRVHHDVMDVAPRRMPEISSRGSQ